MVEANPEKRQDKQLIINRLSSILSAEVDCTSRGSVAVFGSILLCEEPSQDIDVWVEGSHEYETAVEEVFCRHQSELGPPLHIILSSHLAGQSDLDSAHRWVVANTGRALEGQLPDYNPELTAEIANRIFKAHGLQRSRRLIEHALVLALSGSWSDGSFTRSAAWNWLFVNSISEDERRSLKNLDDNSLAEELARYDPDLRDLIATTGWHNEEVILRINKLISGG